MIDYLWNKHHWKFLVKTIVLFIFNYVEKYCHIRLINKVVLIGYLIFVRFKEFKLCFCVMQTNLL